MLKTKVYKQGDLDKEWNWLTYKKSFTSSFFTTNCFYDTSKQNLLQIFKTDVDTLNNRVSIIYTHNSSNRTHPKTWARATISLIDCLFGIGQIYNGKDTELH